MRFKLDFTLENKEIPIQYRKSIISFIKLSLSSYNEEYYKRFYNNRDNIIKPYTFSVYFKQPQINGDSIIIKDKKFELNISVEDYETAIILYNSFNNQKYKKFSINKNSWVLNNIVMLMEKSILTESINIKFQSPLCVRSRGNNKDYYYSFEHKEFEDMLKINIKEQIKLTDIPISVVDTFKITAIQPKKLVVKFYEKQIECSSGIFNVSGNKELLTYLYKAGMGSRHSAGFGMFQII